MIKYRDSINWDRIGMGLSFLCALHCIFTPLVILSLPILARYYLVHPLFHLLLSLAIVPVGLVAFVAGYRQHHLLRVFLLGVPGLVLVSMVPYLVHILRWPLPEQALMVVGSALLISGHWVNRKSCLACERHSSH